MALAAFSIALLGLLFGDGAPALVKQLWRSVRAVGHRAEVAFNLDVVDRSDLPFRYDTIGHFGLYAMAGALAWFVFRERASALAIGTVVVAVSGLIEVAQPLLSEGRNMEGRDFVANAVGVTVGVVAASIGTRVLRLVSGHSTRA
ncbi:MAG: hypothetical protein R2706_11870 [Acidimicrobiales bacterium]